MRKSKPPPLGKVLHSIRKSLKDGIAGINWVKHRGDPRTLRQVIEQISGTPSGKLIVGEDPFPVQYRDIHSHRPRLQVSSQWQVEMQWLLGILPRFGSKLKKYVRLRSEFGRAFLLGEYETARGVLDDIESSISKSLWSLDKNFLLTQYQRGFSGNKELLSSIHSECQNPHINLLALFSSIRVEGAIDLPSYDHILDGRIGAVKERSNERFADYLTSLLSFPPKIHLQNVAYILYRSNEASIIDRLNCVCRCLRAILLGEEGRGALMPFLRQIQKLAEATLEPTLLETTHTLQGEGGEPFLPDDYPDFLTALDSYTEGNYEDCIPRISAFITNHPASFSPYLVASKAYANVGLPPAPLGHPTGLASQVLNSLCHIMAGKGEAEHHVLRLMGYALDLGENHLAFGLHNFALDLMGYADGGERAGVCSLS